MIDRALAAIAALATAVGCGGSVVFEEGNGGSGGSGASGGTTKSSSSPSTAQSGSTSVGVPVQCAGLPFGQCVSNPACAPIFDDACCPSCSPGPCADCIDWAFLDCLPREVACNGDFACGFAGEYVCQGAVPSCLGFCDGTMGCEPAICPPNGPPCNGCAAIVPGVCTAQCDVPPPACPPGFVAASDGFCWTGQCIDQEICL